MREITIKLYSFDELSESAKDRAWLKWVEGVDTFALDSEFEATLKAFEDTFGVDVYHWHVDENHFSFRFAVSNNETFDCWLRFATWVWNNYGDKILTPKYYGKLVHQQGKHPRHIKRYSRSTVERTCSLTGFFVDYDITNAFWRCLHYKEAYFSYEQLIKECLTEFFTEWRNQMEYELSMEAFEEACSANEYEFTEYGEMWG